MQAERNKLSYRNKQDTKKVELAARNIRYRKEELDKWNAHHLLNMGFQAR